jgi:exonuclease III
VPNVGIPTFIKQVLLDLKAQIDPKTMILGVFNTPLSSMNRLSKQKNQIEPSEKDTIDQIDLTDICRVFHPAAAYYTFFSATHGTFSKTDYLLRHKASLNKYKKIKITPYILSDLNGIKLELSNKRNYRKYSNTWRLSKIC